MVKLDNVLHLFMLLDIVPFVLGDSHATVL